jgi:7,8-dihydroneopterin aldolase/epimerase/oxygenase
MLTIHLTDLLFFAFHGLYPEEQILGTNYRVNLYVKYMPTASVITQIENTLNYEDLFRMVEERMRKPTPLLETIVMEVAQQIMKTYLVVEEVFVKLEKCNPPISGLQGAIGVSFSIHRQ